MTKPRQFTPLEIEAMEAVAFFTRRWGGAPFLVEQFGLNSRTAHRLVAQQQPPPAGIADRLADYATEEAIEKDVDRAITPLRWHDHIKALRDFAKQRRTPKGESNG